MTDAWQQVREIVDAQAKDDGLWFDAATASEAYLQQELRRLHAAVETVTDDWHSIETAPRDREVILWRPTWPEPTQGRWIGPDNSWRLASREPRDGWHMVGRAGWYTPGYAEAIGPVEPTHWRYLPEPPAVTD